MGNADKGELITGHGEEPHVDADDHALLLASCIGPEVYRLTGKQTAEIEVTSENEVTINPGLFLIHGRYYRVKQPIALQIETGSQGQNRNDLVVAEYSYSGSENEYEDIDLVVVTGTPANPGSEEDPDIEDDLTLFDIEYGGSITSETIIQVPLWRVPKEGITTQDPVALFEDYMSASQARSSIAQIIKTEKQTALMNGTTNKLFEFDLDIPEGYTACALQYLSISSSNAACVVGSYRIDGSGLKINIRNTSGAQISAEVEASILCLRLP